MSLKMLRPLLLLLLRLMLMLMQTLMLTGAYSTQMTMHSSRVVGDGGLDQNRTPLVDALALAARRIQAPLLFPGHKMGRCDRALGVLASGPKIKSPKLCSALVDTLSGRLRPHW